MSIQGGELKRWDGSQWVSPARRFWDGSKWAGVDGASDVEPSLPAEFTGGWTYEFDGHRVHAFDTVGSDDLIVVEPGEVDVLVVAAGGSGKTSSTHAAGSGGAGGVVWEQGVFIDADTPLSVGDAVSGDSGEDSTFGSYTAIGGGGGNDNGGSGGGQGTNGTAPGEGTPGQGNDGGAAAGGGTGRRGGGGGGFSEQGEDAVADMKAGDGGDGLDASSFFGTSIGDDGWFAGGGGGSSRSSDSTNGVGGKGGGGNGAYVGEPGTNGMAGTGGGGGGGGSGENAGIGGTGIILVRYPL